MPTITEACDAQRGLSRFLQTVEADSPWLVQREYLRQWLFMDRRIAAGAMADMNFYGFDGAAHVAKFFNWARGFTYPDYLPEKTVEELSALSAARDRECLERLGQTTLPNAVENVARVNAQDFLLQRLYPVPERQAVRRILDFGGGHGRMANLAFATQTTDMMAVVDGIPGPYLTQRAYFTGLGLRLADYIDTKDSPEGFQFGALAQSHDMIHLPIWRMDLLPSDWFDLVCCVQVLKEVPLRLLLYALSEFARVLKPGGALYIRDHNQYHNPNHMPMPEDSLVAPFGFTLEFRPHLRDHRDLHGLPRIWRKVDLETYLGPEND